MKTGPKRALAVIAVVGSIFAYRQAAYYGFVPRPNALKSVVPLKIETVDAEVLGNKADVKIAALPSTSVTPSGATTIRFLTWEWNPHMAPFFANGGPITTKGSLMDQNHVRVKFERQDDTDEMRAQQIAFANDFCASGADSGKGAMFVTIMGDQGAGYIGPANEKLKALGADCQLEVVGSFGYSRGEDALMGPPEWKANPQLAKGSLVAGAVGEGDWNLAMRWMHENNIANNPDEHSFDPDAVNWINVTYTEAPERYIAGYCEDRPLKGKPSQKVNRCVSAIVTWTPGDVTAVEKKGGLVKLMDTGSAIFQMPCIIVGNKKWDATHADLVAGMLAGAAEGADQVRANPKALHRAGEISAQIYHDQNADYWVKYYTGVTERDRVGNEVFLGGSAVSNLADEFQLFGLNGGTNLFKATYETFGNVFVQQLPNRMKSYPPVASIQNTRFLKMAADKAENVDKGAAEKITYDTKPMKEVTGKRAYSVNFATGSAEILPTSYPTLDEIAGYLETENTKVAIVGHTDATGSADKNRILSQQRAQSVKEYLMRAGRSAIPNSRVSRIEGRGPDDPVASNDTPQGRAQNRRVEIALGR